MQTGEEPLEEAELEADVTEDVEEEGTTEEVAGLLGRADSVGRLDELDGDDDDTLQGEKQVDAAAPLATSRMPFVTFYTILRAVVHPFFNCYRQVKRREAAREETGR